MGPGDFDRSSRASLVPGWRCHRPHASLSLPFARPHAGDQGEHESSHGGSLLLVTLGAPARARRIAGKHGTVLVRLRPHDAYTLWEAPDNVSIAAVALAITGGGVLSSLETTVLLTVDETLDALRKAKEIQYRPPGA